MYNNKSEQYYGVVNLMLYTRKECKDKLEVEREREEGVDKRENEIIV